MKPYPIQLEISGPTAMWTRPDTGSSPVSYVAPTFSAVKGIFESVLRWKSVNVRPLKVEICAPVQFHRYTTNYGGPLRASDALEISSPPQSGESTPPRWEGGVRRADEVWRTNCQTAPTEVSNPNCINGHPVRLRTRLCETENHELPTMLRMVFDQSEFLSKN